MLIDAVRMSLNVMVVFGSETLCRPWCIGAIVCAYRKGTPLHTVIFTNPRPEDTASVVGSGTGAYVKAFTGKMAEEKRVASFEVDTFTLRGHGLSQMDVHPALQALAIVEPALRASLAVHFACLRGCPLWSVSISIQRIVCAAKCSSCAFCMVAWMSSAECEYLRAENSIHSQIL